MVDTDNLSPGMRQYMNIKNKHPDCVVLFRMGDFYETFYDDAKTVSRELEITLTKRGKGAKEAPLAGIPYHALDNYLPKLVKKGYKVVIVEQTEDPKFAKGLVKRDVLRVVTPGTIVSDECVGQKVNNYIMSIFSVRGKYGVSVCDLSTGEFTVTHVSDVVKLFSEIPRFSPQECLVSFDFDDRSVIAHLKDQGVFVTRYDSYNFDFRNAYKRLTSHFDTVSLAGYGIDDDEVIVCSAGALITYLYDTQKTSLSQITKIRKFASDSYMIIDPSTLRNLEIVSNVRDGSCNGSLLSVIDRTLTPMGGRLLRSCILRPLMDAKVIKSRLDAVDSFCNDSIMKSDTREILAKVNDIERLVGKVSLGSANPRDLVALKRSIEQVPKLKKVISNSDSSYVLRCADFADLSEICKLIDDSIDEDSSLNLKLGHVIKGGYNSSVDELRSILHGGRDWIVRLEKKERERSGIKSLRVGFNKVFGYYIEITNTYKDKAPEDYIRKQTLANAERYITEELKQMEEKVLGAEERMLGIEAQIFSSVVEKICIRISDLQSTARNLASVDVVSSLADVAQLNNYIKPEVCEGYDLEINGGRHPVVEKLVDESFVSNDCSFSEKMKMMIITGCNMSGKSTFMRQVAIIQLLAQIGSFVPADSAKLGIVDRIFTRIGAFDDLSHGQSTFMVEMSETANIINNATERSLIVLDEIGRGTSTYDGVSIAWAVAEHIYQSIGAKTLFATHYHVLNKMSEQYDGIKNFNVAVKEKGGDVIFLRRIVMGGTDKSYGIEVAKLAGLPKKVLDKSKEIMGMFEGDDKLSDKIDCRMNGKVKGKTVKKLQSSEVPMSLRRFVRSGE